MADVVIRHDGHNVVIREQVAEIEVGAGGYTGPIGPEGPQGPAGPKGDMGAPGAAADRHEHIQGVPAAVWVANHNLGRIPGSFVVYDSANTTVEGYDVQSTTTQTVFTFGGAFGGEAVIT